MTAAYACHGPHMGCVAEAVLQLVCDPEPVTSHPVLSPPRSSAIPPPLSDISVSPSRHYILLRRSGRVPQIRRVQR
jgi:hypothetical protein